jgi:phage shock protein PspC (stress-responsive transcriptional regulator)
VLDVRGLTFVAAFAHDSTRRAAGRTGACAEPSNGQGGIMECAYCKTSLEPGWAFCGACGKPTSGGAGQPRTLFRRSAEGRLGGVCAGIAEYLDADVTLVRLAWVILSIVPGGFVGGIVAYIAAMIIMPDASQAPEAQAGPKRRLTRSIVDRKIGGVCGGIAEYLSVDPTAVRFVWIVLTIVPGAIIFGIAAYLVAWFIMPESRREVLTSAPSAA